MCQLAEEVYAAIVDVQKLHLLAVNAHRRIHYDPVHKLVSQFRGQGFQLCDSLDLLNETLQALGLICFDFQIEASGAAAFSFSPSS